MNTTYKTKYLKRRYLKHVTGCPSFDASGSISGMKKQYYGESAMLVRCGGFIYNISGLSDRFNIYNN